MINKPMLSVERELLEELQWYYKPYDDHYHKESGYYCPMCGSEKSQGHDAKCEIKAVFDKPAAQHQGEPVSSDKDPDIWVFRLKGEIGVMRASCEKPEQDQVDQGVIIPFFRHPAEQPAPVVAPITDEQILEAMRSAITNADGGYVVDTAPQDVIAAGRALLADVDRLNGLKP